jgi:hypothetical protein
MNRLQEIKNSLDEMNQTGKSSGMMVLKKVFDQYGIDLVDGYTEIDGITFIKSTISHEDKQYEVVFYQYTEIFEKQQHKTEVSELASKRMATYIETPTFKTHLESFDSNKQTITTLVIEVYSVLCCEYDYDFEITDELISDILQILKDIDFNSIITNNGLTLNTNSLFEKYSKYVNDKKLMSLVSDITD